MPAVKSRPSLADRLRNRLADKTADVGVVGLGYVGLPLAEAFAASGFAVRGFDVDDDKVAKLNRGESYIRHIPAGRVAELLRTERFRATADPDVFDDVDVIVICVPTPLTEAREPDLSYVVATGRMLAKHLQAGPTRRPRKHDLSRHDRRTAAADPGAIRPAGRARFLPRLQPRARGSGQPEVLLPDASRRSSAASTPASRELAAQFYAAGRQGSRAGVEHPRRRGVQDSGEHLSSGEHRARQRTENRLRRDGHRRLGSDRGGEDQAVRLPGVLSRARAWAGTASRSIRST